MAFQVDCRTSVARIGGMGLQGKGRASVELIGERLGGNKGQRVWESSVSVDGGSVVENERVCERE
jgi:hypothetical protein